MGPLAEGRATPGSWTSRCCASGCRTAVEPRTFYAGAPGALGRRGRVAVAARSRRARWRSATARSAATQRAPRCRSAAPRSAGLTAGTWCACGVARRQPARPARRGRALALLRRRRRSTEPLELLGYPEAVLTLASDRPLRARRRAALRRRPGRVVAARHARPAQPHPPRRATSTPSRSSRAAAYDACASALGAIAHAFPAGHRIRLAVSPTYWPWAWPSPEPVTLTVFAGRAGSSCPCGRHDRRTTTCARSRSRSRRRRSRSSGPAFLAARGASVRRDLESGRHELVVGVDHFGARRLVRDELLYRERAIDTFAIVEGEPLSAMARSEWTIELERGDWRMRVETSSALSGDAEAFHVTNALDAYEGDARIFAKTWSRRSRETSCERRARPVGSSPALGRVAS